MCRAYRVAALLIALACVCQPAGRAQARRGGAGSRLSGVYRINPQRSDALYSVVASASSNLPFAEQQKFFVDLAVRLTPPDLLAIERRGRRVQIASSRAPRISFDADGVAHSERTADGHRVTTRAAFEGDRLSVNVAGGTDDRFSVVFVSLDGGRSLDVTRRITAPQLNEPVVVHSVYEKISDEPRWDVYGESQLASKEGDARPSPSSTAATTSSPRSPDDASRGGGWAEALRSALDEWVRATNERDIARQMEFYAPTLEAFYLTRNVPRSAVRAEKQRVFARASAVDVRADAPEIILTDAGRTAVMRFRKQYEIANGAQSRRGAVVQELRWRRTPEGWKITSERDVRVLR
ncbi:MAG: nuclear transport factor 2 family protein [Pyrinomonadaceae bacterium]